MTKARTPLLTGSAGESKRYWNNQRRGTTAEIVCEICGTVHPKQKLFDNGHIIDLILGLECVEDCCGAIIDRLYREWGEMFALEFLKDFAKNPVDPKFRILRMALLEALSRAAANVGKISSEVEAMTKDLYSIKK